ncbi:DUF6545 domain-containing protein [Streptomyces sp. NPDC046759]|uniref:DUF6545 domain-containing protein n=1 Tax=Streptomyces sp. NPDC046759 TaxID=3155019 RepID=UPI0033D09AA9
MTPPSPDPSPPARLDRFATHIRDVVFLLRGHAPYDLAGRAFARAETGGAPKHATEVQAEALWIGAAPSVADEPTHESAGVSAPYPFDPGATPGEGVSHLRDLASAYRLTTSRTPGTCSPVSPPAAVDQPIPTIPRSAHDSAHPCASHDVRRGSPSGRRGPVPDRQARLQARLESSGRRGRRG